MPFPASWIEENITQAAQTGRLGHAFLLSGAETESLETLFNRLACALLEESDPHHPDLHILRPESKSRRIVISQIRELERALQLKPHRAPCKVAGIISAERMCMGSTESANAFLKTLEEPPEQSVIFLLTNRPELLLPTIRSRCLFLPLKTEEKSAPSPELKKLSAAWTTAKGAPADVAYRRAVLLTEYWQNLRVEIENEFNTALKEADESAKDVLKAQIESQFILMRDQSIAHLISEVWNRSRNNKDSQQEACLTCESLEEMRSALNHNMDFGLAVEHCCLKIGGLV